MNIFTSNENGGLYFYEKSGFHKVLNLIAILIFLAVMIADIVVYKGIPDFKLGPGSEFYACSVMIFWFSYLYSRKVEVYFLNKENLVERVFIVFGLRFKKVFRLDRIHLVSKTQKANNGEYDNLYLVESTGKRYFIGQSCEPESSTVAMAAAEAANHCNLKYSHDF